MKPGKGDIKTNILIQGNELDALQEITDYFTECFGLDDRIYDYKGIRPIGLYRWDIECLIAGIEAALESKSPYARLSPETVKSLSDLLVRFKTIEAEVYSPKTGYRG